MTEFTEDHGTPSYEQLIAAGNRLAAELDACNQQLEAMGEQSQLIDNFDAVLQWRKLLKQQAINHPTTRTMETA